MSFFFTRCKKGIKRKERSVFQYVATGACISRLPYQFGIMKELKSIHHLDSLPKVPETQLSKFEREI